MEQFGEMYRNLPPLRSDFLDTTLPVSRNVPKPKMKAKDIFTTPSMSPKPLSKSIPKSPCPAPRSISHTTQSPLLSLKHKRPPPSRGSCFISSSEGSSAAVSGMKNQQACLPSASPRSTPIHHLSPKMATKKPRYLRVKQSKTNPPLKQSPPHTPAKISLCHKESPTDNINNCRMEEEMRCIRELPSSPLMGTRNYNFISLLNSLCI